MNGGCGTTAGWKTSPYVHLLLGGKPQASCIPHSGLPGRARNVESMYNYQDLKFYHYCYLSYHYYLIKISCNTNQVLEGSPLSTTQLLYKVHTILHIACTCRLVHPLHHPRAKYMWCHPASSLVCLLVNPLHHPDKFPYTTCMLWCDPTSWCVVLYCPRHYVTINQSSLCLPLLQFLPFGQDKEFISH